MYPEVTNTFIALASLPFQSVIVGSETFAKIERFIVIMYDELSPLSSVNAARMEIFCKNNRAIERLPPTQVCTQETSYIIHIL